MMGTNYRVVAVVKTDRRLPDCRPFDGAHQIGREQYVLDEHFSRTLVLGAPIEVRAIKAVRGKGACATMAKGVDKGRGTGMGIVIELSARAIDVTVVKEGGKALKDLFFTAILQQLQQVS